MLFGLGCTSFLTLLFGIAPDLTSGDGTKVLFVVSYFLNGFDARRVLPAQVCHVLRLQPHTLNAFHDGRANRRSRGDSVHHHGLQPFPGSPSCAVSGGQVSGHSIHICRL